MVILLILDGWGIAKDSDSNAISLARPVNFNTLQNEYLSGELRAAGEAVGLPEGEDGNSEVGHLNLGIGRVALQELSKINLAIVDGSFFQNQAFLKVIDHVKRNNGRLHLIGVIGSGGVHAFNDHLFALMRLAKTSGIEKLYLHLITDGRDSPPTEAKTHILAIEKELKLMQLGEIATVMGRYYAMDRDLRWERTQAAYEALVGFDHDYAEDAIEAVEKSYQNHLTDEFIKPTQIGKKPEDSRLKDNDGLIFFNFRVDRARQLTKALVLPNFEKLKFKLKGFDPYDKYKESHILTTEGEGTFKRKLILENLKVATMTQYEDGLPVEVAFTPEVFKNSLGEVVSKSQKKQIRIAETEKERFVTFYFNGRNEAPFVGEDRLKIESPKVPTYDMQPEMATPEIAAKTAEAIKSRKYDLVVVNFACPDMVAHTGNIEATKKAILAADKGIKKISEAALATNSTLIITADHGNAEELRDLENGEMDTEHSVNPVPVIIVNHKYKRKKKMKLQGVLADVAPTILKLLQIENPVEITGKSLL